jgi:hypothetical protein
MDSGVSSSSVSVDHGFAMELEFGEGVNVGKLELIEDETFGPVTWELDVVESNGRILVGSHPLTDRGSSSGSSRLSKLTPTLTKMNVSNEQLVTVPLVIQLAKKGCGLFNAVGLSNDLTGFLVVLVKLHSTVGILCDWSVTDMRNVLGAHSLS